MVNNCDMLLRLLSNEEKKVASTYYLPKTDDILL